MLIGQWRVIFLKFCLVKRAQLTGEGRAGQRVCFSLKTVLPVDVLR